MASTYGLLTQIDALTDKVKAFFNVTFLDAKVMTFPLGEDLESVVNRQR